MRLIDADELIVMEHGGIKFVPKEFIDDAPTVDAVPVIRCKDCKHYQFSVSRAFACYVNRCEITGFEDVDDDDFCSRAERRQE